MLSTCGNAAEAAEQIGGDFQPVQGCGNLSGASQGQGQGQPMICWHLVCCHCKGCAHTEKLACVLANILTCPALGWENLLVSSDNPHMCVFLAYAQVSMAPLGTHSEPPPPNN